MGTANKLLLPATLLFLVMHGQGMALTFWPDTGQSRCYDNVGPIPCPQSGEPFYGQDAQYLRQQPSYTKLDSNGNALPQSAEVWSMVHDTVTDLTWEVKSDDDSLHDWGKSFYWCNSNIEDSGSCEQSSNTENFINALNKIRFGGYDDWRLPTVKELTTLLNSGKREPAIDTSFFPFNSSDECEGCGIYNNRYWTSEHRFYRTNSVWIVEFEDGGNVHSSYKTDYARIRAVRGGREENTDRYIIPRDGTVTDVNTGLMWQQDTSVEVGGLSGNDNLDWEDALAYAEGMNRIQFSGHSNWRLPTRNELQTLMDYSLTYPSLNTDIFPITTYFYWSSTTEHGVAEKAWMMDFYIGNALNWEKTAEYNVRLVRTVEEIELLVSLTGHGLGTVTSFPEGISCGDDCGESYRYNRTVTLTANDSKTGIFTGWSGACAGTGICSVTLDQAKSVSANFRRRPLTVPLSLLLID